MATIPELLDGHIALEVECLDRLYLNGYIGRLATGIELSMFMRNQLGKPVPSPVVLGQVSEKFREAVIRLAEREDIPVHQFKHEERKDDIANDFRGRRPLRDEIVFIGVAQEKAKTFNEKKGNAQFEFEGDTPTMPFYRSPCGRPWIAWTRSSACSFYDAFPLPKAS
jgi:hypothetical protein